MRATKVNAGLAESNGRLLLGIWRDSLHVTCGLTACRPGSAPGPTLGNEYGKTLPFTSEGSEGMGRGEKGKGEGTKRGMEGNGGRLLPPLPIRYATGSGEPFVASGTLGDLTWLEDFLTSKWPGSFTALVPPLQERHPACKKTEWWGASVVVCLEQGADNSIWSTYKLYDLHAIFIPDYQFQKVFFNVSLGNNFFNVFFVKAP